MKAKRFLAARDSAITQNAILKFGMVCMAVSILALAYTTVAFRKHERTILVPPTLRSEVHITDGKANDAYIREFSRLIAALAFNHSPRTARANFVDLLTFYAPEAYPQAQEMWMMLAEDIENSGVSTIFYIDPNGITIDERKQKVILKGVRNQFQEKSPLTTEKTAFEVQYTIQSGHFYIKVIGETDVR